MRPMYLDPKQVLAGFLTFSMFAMLGNMVKRDHFDTMQGPTTSTIGVFDDVRVEPNNGRVLGQVNKVPWKENVEELKPCWSTPKTNLEETESKGLVMFSLTTGPEYHISQITDAVVIARYLGATLVLPDIRGRELGQKRNFEDMYDINKFMKSMKGVVKIVREAPAEVASGKPAVVRVPARVTKEFIVKNIEPMFRTKNYLRLVIVFPSISLRSRGKQNDDLDSTFCRTMFGSLELKPEIQEVANGMVDKLKTLSHESKGKFIAVDLRVGAIEKGCKDIGGKGKKTCYGVQEVGDFLKKVGGNSSTTIYLTQTWWHESLSPLKQAFPKTYIKDDIIPADKKAKFLGPKSSELQRALDFHICSKGDVFVPAVSGIFYGNVAGKRISYGRTQILDPAQVPASPDPDVAEFLSSYVSKRNHLAYSCHC